MKKCVCLWPTHKYELTELEAISLNRCLDVMKNYDCVFVMPEGMDHHKFIEQNVDKQILLNYLSKHEALNAEYFDPSWFRCNHAYSSFQLSYDLYERFVNDYENILLVEPDAFVFSDMLEYFLDKEFKYLGNYEYPYEHYFLFNFIKNDYTDVKNKIFLNSGFSLRNIKAMLAFLEQESYMCNDIISNNDIYVMSCDDLISQRIVDNDVDLFTSVEFGFSFVFAEHAWVINNYKYPFGCHGFYKSNFLLYLIQNFLRDNNIQYNVNDVVLDATTIYRYYFPDE